MQTKTLFRLSGWAVVVGSVLMAVGYLLKPTADDPLQIYATPATASILSFIGVLLLLIGLPGQYAYQANRAGILGLVSFSLLFLGFTALEAGSFPLFGIMFRFLAADPATQGLIASGGPLENHTPMMVYYLPSLIAANLGNLLYSIATIRAGVYPRWAGWIMLAGIPLIALNDYGIAVTMMGLAWCGLTMAGVTAPRINPSEMVSQPT